MLGMRSFFFLFRGNRPHYIYLFLSFSFVLLRVFSFITTFFFSFGNDRKGNGSAKGGPVMINYLFFAAFSTQHACNQLYCHKSKPALPLIAQNYFQAFPKHRISFRNDWYLVEFFILRRKTWTTRRISNVSFSGEDATRLERS